MKTALLALLLIFSILFMGYTIVGTDNKVSEIKKKAPQEMAQRNWKILRYEGFEYGSWNRHGGKVWYHVCNIDNPNIQYRVNVSIWNGELQWYYGKPEELQRIEVNYTK